MHTRHAAWPAWTLAGILAAMLAGTIHALAEYVLDLRGILPSEEQLDGIELALQEEAERMGIEL